MNLSLDELFLQIQRLYPETFPFSHWKLSDSAPGKVWSSAVT